MSRTNTMKITVQISYTDTAERVQDLLQYVRFMESSKKKRSQSAPNATRQREICIPFPERCDEPF